MLNCRFTFAQIDISYARFFFLQKRGKSTIICAFKLRGFNYFYMSLGQVRYTMNMYPRDSMYSNLVLSPDEYFLY